MSRAMRSHTSMRGRLAILLVALLVLPLTGVGWLGYHALRNEVQSGSDPERTRMELQAALNAAVVGLRTHLRADLADLALRVAHLRDTSATERELAFADLPRDLQPVLLARVPAVPAAVRGVPPEVLEALAETLDADRPLRGWLSLPLSDGLAPCEVVVEPRGRERLLAVRPIGPRLASFGTLDGIDRALLLPDGPPLTVGRQASAEPFGTVPDCRALVELCATRWASDASHGASMMEVGRAQVVMQALVGPLGHPSLVLAAASTPNAAGLAAARDAALLARAASHVGWLAAAGVLLALCIGLLAPRIVWRDLRGTTDFIFASVDRMRELVNRIGLALTEQASLLQSLVGSVARLDGESREIAGTGRALAHSAEQSEWSSHAGHQRAESAQRSVLDMRDRVEDIRLQMEELERRCGAIGSILAYLDHLTSETGSVSINATIQAAGSGGTGRQLSAMASEIQKLADLASGSTREIRQLVEEIQDASRATLGTTQDGRQQVERCLGAFEEVEQDFGRILRWVEDTKRCAQGIEGGTARQSDSLRSVAGDVEAIGQRARETLANFEAVVDAADELAELGRRVNETWKVG